MTENSPTTREADDNIGFLPKEHGLATELAGLWRLARGGNGAGFDFPKVEITQHVLYTFLLQYLGGIATRSLGTLGRDHGSCSKHGSMPLTLRWIPILGNPRESHSV